MLHPCGALYSCAMSHPCFCSVGVSSAQSPLALLANSAIGDCAAENELAISQATGNPSGFFELPDAVVSERSERPCITCTNNKPILRRRISAGYPVKPIVPCCPTSPGCFYRVSSGGPL